MGDLEFDDMEENEDLDLGPFDFNFEFSETELLQLKDAYSNFADSEGKISFFEIFHVFAEHNNSNQLVFGIL